MKGLKVGVSGWHRLDAFYPPRTRPGDMLGHYAEQFALAEVSTTFQGIPNLDRVREWADAVPDGFTFDVIAFGGLTLHQRRPGDSQAAEVGSWTDVAVEPPGVLFDEFTEAISPLVERDLLGLLILQFPSWFEFGQPGLDYLSRCREAFGTLRLGVEFRNVAWFEPSDRLDTTLDTLIELEMAMVAADFPGAGSESPPLVAQVSLADVAPVRLHGRAGKDWAKLGPDGSFTSDYEYSEDDLAMLVPTLKELGEEADEVHVLFNVSPADAAADSCRRLVELIEASEIEPDYSQWRPPPGA